MAEGLQVTPISEWREPGTAMRLPSGMVVRVMPVSIVSAIARGNIPNPLLAPIAEAFTKTGSTSTVLNIEDPTLQMQFMSWLAKQVLAYPVLWDGQGERPANSIPQSWLSDADILALAVYAMNGVTELTPFRAEPTGDNAGQDSDAVQPEAGDVGGDH